MKGPAPFDYGLSITLPDRGHILSPEGYIMAEEMIKYMYEKLDVELMLHRVDRTYRKYGIQNTVSMIANSLDIQNITNDKGVSFDEEMNPIEYNYADESKEPTPTAIDNLAPVTHLSDKSKLANLMSVTHFNDLYMRNVGASQKDPRNVLSESLYESSLKGESRKMTAAIPPLTS